MTCAHRTFPFGTLLRVKNLSNGKEVTVKVTDRGPFVRGRIIDLSWGAAKQLDILSRGVAMVEVEKVEQVNIPFKNNNKPELPEFDFQVPEVGTKFIEQWKAEGSKKEPTTTTPPPTTAPGKTPKQPKVQPHAGKKTDKQAPAEKETERNSVFEKIKNWKEELF